MIDQTTPICEPCEIEGRTVIATKLYRMAELPCEVIPVCPQHAFSLKKWSGELVDIADA